VQGGAGGQRPGVLILGSANNQRVRAVAACTEVTDDVDVYGGGWDRLLNTTSGGQASAESSYPQPLKKRLADLHYLAPRILAEGSWFFSRFSEQRGVLDAAVIRSASRARFHGLADDAEVPRLMAGAKFMLGINQRRGEIGDRFGLADSRLRDFEAPLSGAFYLVQNFVDLPLFYRLGVEVESWSTLDELTAKVRHYLDRPEDRARIAAAGRERALRDHTWDVRLGDLMHILGLRARAAGDGAPPAPLDVVANLSSSPWCGDSPGCEPSAGHSDAAPRLDARTGQVSIERGFS
jgi:hypothetical protein